MKTGKYTNFGHPFTGKKGFYLSKDLHVVYSYADPEEFGIYEEYEMLDEENANIIQSLWAFWSEGDSYYYGKDLDPQIIKQMDLEEFRDTYMSKISSSEADSILDSFPKEKKLNLSPLSEYSGI